MKHWQLPSFSWNLEAPESVSRRTVRGQPAHRLAMLTSLTHRGFIRTLAKQSRSCRRSQSIQKKNSSRSRFSRAAPLFSATQFINHMDSSMEYSTSAQATTNTIASEDAYRSAVIKALVDVHSFLHRTEKETVRYHLFGLFVFAQHFS